MAGATLTVTLQGTDAIARALGRLRRVTADPTPTLRAIGAGLVETTQRRFESARDPEGRPWAPWSPAYAAVTTSRSILRSRRGNAGLMGSITFDVPDRRTVRVGSNKIYAAVHQFGATITPKRGRFLTFRLGPRVVRARRVTIPARPYLGFGEADRAIVLAVIRAQTTAALQARKS